MTTSSRTNWGKGKREVERIRVRAFGEVFVAFDKRVNDIVAIKQVNVRRGDEVIASESKLLKECQSRYIVRYYDVLQREGKLWVCCCLIE